MRTLVISKDDSNQRLDKFLTKYLKNMPLSLIYKYLRKKRIKVNNKKCEISYKLSQGDIVNLYINDEFFSNNVSNMDFLNAPLNLNILYEDKNILIIDKEAGLVVHPDQNCKIDCLINRIKKYLYVKNEYNPHDKTVFSPSLANRIDRNTAGIVISAKNSEALRILNNKIKNREISKFYLCKVDGNLDKNSDTLIAYLRTDTASNISEISFTEKPGYKKIVTKYEVIHKNRRESLLKIELITGRKHQIRAHLAALGHPILGDVKYGTNLRRNHKKYPYQALCSYKIQFDEFHEPNLLDYLKNKSFQVKNIWFLENFPYPKIWKI